jgi:hypothetical protein
MRDHSWPGTFCVLFFLSIFSTTLALQVTPGSSCASICMDVQNGDPMNPASSNTNVSEIACTDVDFYSTAKGLKFKNCMDCLQKSPAVSGDESDSLWFLCK